MEGCVEIYPDDICGIVGDPSRGLPSTLLATSEIPGMNWSLVDDKGPLSDVSWPGVDFKNAYCGEGWLFIFESCLLWDANVGDSAPVELDMVGISSEPYRVA